MHKFTAKKNSFEFTKNYDHYNNFEFEYITKREETIKCKKQY